MTATKYCFLGLLLALSPFMGCKKDLGNYAYEDLPDFYLGETGSQAAFEVLFGEKVQIIPKVVYEGGNEVKYLWRIYGKNGLADTIAHTRELDYNMIRPLGTYTLEFYAIENPTARVVAKQYNITVTPPYAEGLLVGHGNDSHFDVDFIRTPMINASWKDTRVKNIFSLANGAPVSGKLSTLFSRNSSNSVVLVSENRVETVEIGTFLRLFEYDELFAADYLRPAPTDKMKAAVLLNSLIIGNKVYCYSNPLQPQLDVIAQAPDDRGIEPSAKSQGSFVYDEKNHRFFNRPSIPDALVPYVTNNSLSQFLLHDIGPKELLFFMQGNNMGTGTVHHALFKDKLDGSLHLYLIRFSTSLTANHSVAKVNVSGATNLDKAIAFEILTTSPVMYYADETTVRRLLLSVDGSFQHNTAGFEAPAGEVITYMWKFNNNGLFVATWNEAEKQGKLYLLPVAFGGAVGSAIQTWTGFEGKITQMSSKTK